MFYKKYLIELWLQYLGTNDLHVFSSIRKPEIMTYNLNLKLYDYTIYQVNQYPNANAVSASQLAQTWIKTSFSHSLPVIIKMACSPTPARRYTNCIAIRHGAIPKTSRSIPISPCHPWMLVAIGDDGLVSVAAMVTHVAGNGGSG